MSRFLKSLFLFCVVAPLAGCTLFYPNWGATGLPEDQITLTPTITETGSESASPTESASESTSPTATESQSAAPTQKKVEVEIVFAMAYPEDGIVEVVAQVPNLAETSGVCTLELSGPSDLTVKVKAEPSSDFMQCAPFDVQISDLAAGSYQAVVTYESTGHIGKSAAYPVEVPSA